jgi:chaperonin GroES
LSFVLDAEEVQRGDPPDNEQLTVDVDRGNEMVKFKPLHDRVLLRRIDAAEKTPGGVIIPDSAKEKPVEGEVLAVGPGVPDESGKLRGPGVKVGDRVLVAKWAGTEVLIGGEDRLILKESEILGIIETSRRSAAKAA